MTGLTESSLLSTPCSASMFRFHGIIRKDIHDKTSVAVYLPEIPDDAKASTKPYVGGVDPFSGG